MEISHHSPISLQEKSGIHHYSPISLQEKNELQHLFNPFVTKVAKWLDLCLSIIEIGLAVKRLPRPLRQPHKKILFLQLRQPNVWSNKQFTWKIGEYFTSGFCHSERLTNFYSDVIEPNPGNHMKRHIGL